MKTLTDYGIEIEVGESRTTCPECSPSRRKAYDKCLSVDQEQGLWFCHHCGWAGGLGGEKERDEAIRHFEKPSFVESLIQDERVLQWFDQRGITERTLANLKIKSGPAWMPKGGEVNTIQFPFYFDGEVVNVKYRTSDKQFRQEKNARKCLYNFDDAMKSTADRIIITEGEMDVLALHEVGYRAVVSVPDGAPTPNTKNYTTKFDFLDGAEKLLEKFKWVVLAVDNDEPGKRLEEELSRRIGIERCLQVSWPDGCKDANDVLINKGAAMLKQVIDGATLYPLDGVAAVEDLWGAVFDRQAHPEQGGVECGWANTPGNLNIELGQMTIVTGIPSHGKSTWVDALRVSLWKNYGWPSAVFSPENWPSQDHLAVLAEMYAAENFYSMSTDLLHGTLDMMRGGFYFIQPDRDESMMTVDEILKRARVLVYQHGIKILVIDPWNEIEHEFNGNEREDQYISRQLAKIRRFARVNNIHIFVVAHPTKLPKEKDGTYSPPTAYDIAGGAMWRNKGDNILCIYRPDVSTSETEVFIQKIRFRRNGNAGAKLSFTFHVGTSTYHAKRELHAVQTDNKSAAYAD